MFKYIFPLFVVGFSARAYSDPLVVAELPDATAPGVAVDEGAPLLTQRAEVDTHSLHFDSGFGADLGQMNLPGGVASADGMHAVLGLRRGRFALMAEADLAAITLPDANALGLYERLAIEPRLSLWQYRGSSGLSEVYVEPGVGVESVSEPNMPSFTRPDLAVSVGIQRTIQIGRRRLTVYGAARGLAAAPERDLGEHKADTSLMLTSGILIGR